MKKLVWLLLCLSCCAHAQTANIDTMTFASSSEAQRYQSLVQEIRCVVCQGQSIADSDALLANDLRQKVYAMVNEKKSNIDIKDYLVQRYGEFILLQPRLNKLTILLWLFPFVSITTALGFIFFWRRRF